MCKSLFGLKQAHRAWYTKFCNYVSYIVFSLTKFYHSILIYKKYIHKAYILLYVDDIILNTSFDALQKSIISLLTSNFSMKDLGHQSYLLGIIVTGHQKGLLL